MTPRITKASLLREARRVYGEDSILALREEDFLTQTNRFQCAVLLVGHAYAVTVRHGSKSKARWMAMAALQAAGGGR